MGIPRSSFDTVPGFHYPGMYMRRFLRFVRLRGIEREWIRVDLRIFEGMFDEILHETRGVSARTRKKRCQRVCFSWRSIAIFEEGHDRNSCRWDKLPVALYDNSLMIDCLSRPRRKRGRFVAPKRQVRVLFSARQSHHQDYVDWTY